MNGAHRAPMPKPPRWSVSVIVLAVCAAVLAVYATFNLIGLRNHPVVPVRTVVEFSGNVTTITPSTVTATVTITPLLTAIPGCTQVLGGLYSCH